MKKMLCALLAGLLVAGLAACGGAPAASSSAPAASVSAPAASSSVAQPPAEPEEPRRLYPWVLTGKELPQDYGQDRRITAVSVDNFSRARPQRGLSEAEVLFECVVEGGVTRFLALYGDYRGMPQVGPVRSSRDQFFQLAFPWEAIFVSAGSTQRLDVFLDIYDYLGDVLNSHAGATGVVERVERDGDFSVEHTGYTSGGQVTDALAAEGIDGGRIYASTFFNFVPYTEEPRALAEAGGGESLLIQHSANYATGFGYEDGRYAMSLKNADGAMAPAVDENDGRVVAFDNVLVLFADMPVVEGHGEGVSMRDVQFGYGGVGYYFCGGSAERVRWMKDSPAHALRILADDTTETDLALNPGTSYVAFVDVELAAQFAYGAPGAERALG